MAVGQEPLTLLQTAYILLSFYIKEKKEALFGKKEKTINIKHQKRVKRFSLAIGNTKTARMHSGRFLIVLHFCFLIIIITLYFKNKNYSSEKWNKGGGDDSTDSKEI